ncbi:RES family NAD+ phosphorylase, partial [Acinetobacter baumannii]|nr:RES family NAD+ phosphorylase [Acinetobacter baumannii]
MNLDDLDLLFEDALKSLSPNDFINHIEKALDCYQVLSFNFERGSVFWRARKIQSNFYKHIDDLSYPPKDLVNCGRINDKESPFFYLASRRETALAEINSKENDIIQLAGFKIKENENLRIAVVGEFWNVFKTGYVKFLGQDPKGCINRLINSSSKDLARNLIYIDKYFSEILADTKAVENEYLFTRTLSNKLLKKAHTDAIAYPSVKDAGAYNLAVEANKSDIVFENVICLTLKIKSIKKWGIYDYRILSAAEGIDENGNFIWHKNTEFTKTPIYNLTKSEMDKLKKIDNVDLS